jgi:hypothetical protein
VQRRAHPVGARAGGEQRPLDRPGRRSGEEPERGLLRRDDYRPEPADRPRDHRGALRLTEHEAVDQVGPVVLGEPQRSAGDVGELHGPTLLGRDPRS